MQPGNTESTPEAPCRHCHDEDGGDEDEDEDEDGGGEDGGHDEDGGDDDVFCC